MNIDNETIPVNQQIKYLGVILDGSLKWKSHVNYVVSEVSRILGLIKNVLYKAPRDVRMLLRPEISEARSREIVHTLKETFLCEGLQRELCCRGGKKVNEKKTQRDASKTSSEHKPNNENWNCLIFGINAVTRSIEKGETSLVLCDSGVYPSLLTSHLIEMSSLNEVPAGCVLGLSALGEVTGLRSLTTLAFKQQTFPVPLLPCPSSSEKLHSLPSQLDLEDKIANEKLRTTIETISSMLPKIRSPIEPQYPIPKLELSQEDDDAETSQESKHEHLYRLPPDDIDFASLYVFKGDLNFDKQEDFISLSNTMKRTSDKLTDVKPVYKKLRYIPTEVGDVKYNPNRAVKKEKS